MAANIREVDRLLGELKSNLEEARLTLQQQQHLLAEVKVYGRNPQTAGPIFTKEGIKTLSRCALDIGENAMSREALRCLANAFLLNEPSRQKFVDLAYAPKAAERLRNDDADDEFLICRILFLLTYNTDLDFTKLDQDYDVTAALNTRLARHHKKMSGSNVARPAIEQMALVESLKLLFNITYYYPGLIVKFSPSIDSIAGILLYHALPSPPLQPPITSLLNALLNLDLTADNAWTTTKGSSSCSLFPSHQPEVVTIRLLSILEKAVKEHSERDLDEAAAPLCTLLRRVYELAPATVRTYMQSGLLPSDQDREKPLGQGDAISARLLRLSSSSNLPGLRENISSLLFELSDKEPNKFVQNIGYGFASGFLMSHNIEVPKQALETNTGGSQSATLTYADINPVTGQRFSAESAGLGIAPEMTEEEKEREAERLYVLFERLRATGVVDIKNPVQQAKDEGRFEELD